MVNANKSIIRLATYCIKNRIHRLRTVNSLYYISKRISIQNTNHIRTTRLCGSKQFMLESELDLALIEILDNDDPFSDSEIRESADLLTGQIHLYKGSPVLKNLLLQTREPQIQVPTKPTGTNKRVQIQKDPNQSVYFDDDSLSSTFEFSDMDDDFMEALKAAEEMTNNNNNCIKRSASTPLKKPIAKSMKNQSTPSKSSAKKCCKYIKTSSQSPSHYQIRESGCGVDILEGSPNKLQSEKASPFKFLSSFSSSLQTQNQAASGNHESQSKVEQNILSASQSSSPPITISQVRNPFKVPTQFRRNYSTRRITDQESDNKKGNSHHTILLATQKAEAPFKDSSNSNRHNLGKKKEGATEAQSEAKNVKPIILSNEQEYVLKQVLLGVSLFYTGSAGTGKSVLLRSIIKSLRTKFSKGVAVTASTGLAACNIGGITLHSFAGFGLGQGKVDILIKKIKRNKKAFCRWRETKVLIIDEISMVDGHLLNKLNEIAKTLRRNNRPFGGIQLVACGDFYQLPPVVKKTAHDGTEVDNVEVYFAFESLAWKETIQRTITLKEIFRQKGDQRFIDMLNNLRDGNVPDDTVRDFCRLSRPLKCPEGIVPSELYATRHEVDAANSRKLGTIEGDVVVYNSIDTGILPEIQKSQVLANFLAPQVLNLKVGAQVMCIKNFDDQLVNGTLGKVIDFVDKDTYMKSGSKENSSTESSDEVSGLSDYIFNDFQKPKKIVKEDAPIAEQVVFTGQLSQKVEEELESSKRKLKLKEDLMNDYKDKKYPLVKFLLPDGITFRTVVVEPEQWTTEDDEGKVLVSRIQFPLILAWSLSIHKSQGQTLSKVVVDMKNIFENGQAYVALSRAVSREGLQVLNFNRSKVISHRKVIEFYKHLTSHENESQCGQQQLNFMSTSVSSVGRAQI